MSFLIKQVEKSMAMDIDIQKKISEGMGGLAKEYIAQAYQHPLLHDEGMRDEAVAEFENAVYLECYQARKK